LNKIKKYDVDFIIKQIDNAIIGEWQGLFFANTEDEYKQFMKQKSKGPHKNGINIDEINYATNQNIISKI
jgi:hypothetical protein